jgi:hypothetical protein
MSKFEYLIGTENDFNGTSLGCTLKIWHDFFGPMFCTESTIPRQKGVTIIAMRRIIQEPKRWTVEDQKAGRLPEVGANVEFVFNNEFNYYEPIEEFENGDALDVLAHVCGGNGCMCVAVYNRRTRYTTQLVIESIRPLETPEEKSERLRSEWVELARDKALISADEYTTEAIYDALLSGALSAPTKGGE